MIMAMSKLKQRLLKTELARLGFHDTEYSKDEDVMRAYQDSGHAMEIRDSGNVSYNTGQYHIADEIRAAAQRAGELAAVWENARTSRFEGLIGYRLLSEYNNILLAARDDSEHGGGHGLHFATCRFSPGRARLEQVNYTDSYEEAKENFAVRCGLVDKNKLFDEAEMRLIRHGLVHLGADFSELSAAQMTLIGRMVERIETLMPRIAEHEALEQYDHEQEDVLER
jgi:hypothetical protein